MKRMRRAQPSFSGMPKPWASSSCVYDARFYGSALRESVKRPAVRLMRLSAILLDFFPLNIIPELPYIQVGHVTTLSTTTSSLQLFKLMGTKNEGENASPGYPTDRPNSSTVGARIFPIHNPSPKTRLRQRRRGRVICVSFFLVLIRCLDLEKARMGGQKMGIIVTLCCFLFLTDVSYDSSIRDFFYFGELHTLSG